MSPRFSRCTVEENSWTHLISQHFSAAPNTEQIQRPRFGRTCTHSAYTLLCQSSPPLASLCMNKSVPGTVTRYGSEVSVLLIVEGVLRSFAQACPSQAISSHRSGTGQDEWPFPTEHAYDHHHLEKRANTGCFCQPHRTTNVFNYMTSEYIPSWMKHEFILLWRLMMAPKESPMLGLAEGIPSLPQGMISMQAPSLPRAGSNNDPWYLFSQTDQQRIKNKQKMSLHHWILWAVLPPNPAQKVYKRMSGIVKLWNSSHLTSVQILKDKAGSEEEGIIELCKVRNSTEKVHTNWLRNIKQNCQVESRIWRKDYFIQHIGNWN